jgi:transcriptional regulator with XRE-family HTH domain
MSEFASSSVASNIAANIRQLCERHGSIADVCRRVGINRQQFNKYLSGRVLPNPISMRKLCEFFAVSEKDLFLEPEAFKQTASRHHGILSCLPDKHRALLNDMTKGASAGISEGLYYTYYPWLHDPTKTLRGLLAIRKRGDILTFKRFIRFTTPDHDNRHRLQGKHDGVVFDRQGTLFLVALDGRKQGGLSLMTFGRSATGQTGVLVGLAMVQTSWGDPIASRVTLTSVPANMTARQALGQCGLFDLHCNDIDSVTRETIAVPDSGSLPQLMAYSAWQRTLG